MADDGRGGFGTVVRKAIASATLSISACAVGMSPGDATVANDDRAILATVWVTLRVGP